MAAGDLTTVDYVRSIGDLGTSNLNDQKLAGMVSAASQFIRTYTGRDFAVTTYSEIRDGNGGTELFLAHGPATSVSSLTINAGLPIAAQAAEGQQGRFLVPPGNVLALTGYAFSKGRKNVRVTYTAGSATIPADIAQACAEIVLQAFKRLKRGPDVQTETITPGGGETFSFKLDDIPATAKATLNRYRRTASLA